MDLQFYILTADANLSLRTQNSF